MPNLFRQSLRQTILDPISRLHSRTSSATSSRRSVACAACVRPPDLAHRRLQEEDEETAQPLPLSKAPPVEAKPCKPARYALEKSTQFGMNLGKLIACSKLPLVLTLQTALIQSDDGKGLCASAACGAVIGCNAHSAGLQHARYGPTAMFPVSVMPLTVPCLYRDVVLQLQISSLQ